MSPFFNKLLGAPFDPGVVRVLLRERGWRGGLPTIANRNALLRKFRVP